ncbi:hypothetical protein [Streptomyces abikoensis]|uniref:hypothetical protein n=1 Tax=Streptomyces abikoensis TaxID=97398 RepID=UPI001675C0B3|nr:hypothetical protein [Streptomyces abikoensis]
MIETRTRREHRVRALVLAAGVLAGAVLVTGCSEERDAALKWPGAESNPQAVTADQFGAAWPLKPDKGKVACDTTPYSGFAITFQAPDGKIYALNNVAHDEKGYPSVDEIKGNSGKMWRLRSFGMQICSLERTRNTRSTPPATPPSSPAPDTSRPARPVSDRGGARRG